MFLKVVMKDLVLEERIVLPPMSNPGVTVGRSAESAESLSIFFGRLSQTIMP